MSAPSQYLQLTEAERIEIRLAALNDCAPDTAINQFHRCCGSSKWSKTMAGRRPFSTLGALQKCGDLIWQSCAHQDWLEAFAAHPRIGEKSAVRWSSQEQSGMNGLSVVLQNAFAKANNIYEAKFGYTFIVCATGKTAVEMLANLEGRIGNDPAIEILNAAEQQRLITHLRLIRLFTE
jgi:OHCU decarboxylase